MNNASDEAVVVVALLVLRVPPRTLVTIDRDLRCLMVSAWWRRARRGESLDDAEAPRNINNVGWLDVVVSLWWLDGNKMAHLVPSCRCIFGFAVVVV